MKQESPIIGETVEVWADLMITHDNLTNMFILWLTSDYQIGIEVKRMDDLEVLKNYARTRSRIDWETGRLVGRKTF